MINIKYYVNIMVKFYISFDFNLTFFFLKKIKQNKTWYKIK